MPYKGKSVTVVEMLDILASNGRTEAGAALELERAIEDSRIVCYFPMELIAKVKRFIAKCHH